MKQSAGFTRLAPGLIPFAAMPASFLLLARAMRKAATGDRLHGLDRDWRGGRFPGRRPLARGSGHANAPARVRNEWRRYHPDKDLGRVNFM